MRIAILAGAALVSLALGATAQQIYKWTDKDGRVHYGEKPPEDAKANEVRVNAGTSTAAPETPQTWKEKEVEFQKRKQERDKAAGSEQDQARYAENRRKLCANARGELEFISSGAVYTTNEKGERIYMSEPQRERRMEEVKKKIAANC